MNSHARLLLPRRGHSVVRKLVSVTAVLLGIILMTGTVSAQFEVVGGVTYNTYSIKWAGLAANLSGVEFNSGLGAYAGAQYWISDSLAIGAQFDYLTGSGKETFREMDWDGDLINETYEIKATGTGYLATVTMNLLSNERITVRPFAAAGMYGVSTDIKASINYSDPLKVDESVTIKLKPDKRFGGKAGVSFGFEVAPGLTLGAVAAYRYVGEFTSGTYVAEFTSGTMEGPGVPAEFEDMEGLSFSGFMVGASISYIF